MVCKDKFTTYKFGLGVGRRDIGLIFSDTIDQSMPDRNVIGQYRRD